MLLSERRQRYRRVLAGDSCVYPASVFDPMSARMAESLDYEVGMLAGSIASATVLGAPDIVVLTLTEFAEQIRRITRGSSISLMVDADHGYGNALNVMRTVEELETAGVSALTIEDTLLPPAFGGEGEGLISVEEMLGKLRAAVAARQDPSLVIIGRTSALRQGGIDEAVRRLRAYEDTGVDAFFIVGAREPAEVEAIHAATSLPLMLGGSPASLWSDLDFLNTHRVRIALQGHSPFYAAAQAVYDVLKHLKAGGTPADLKTPVAAGDVLSTALRQDDYAGWQDSYLR